MNKKIIVSSPHDERVGFMSNASNFPVTIEGKRWPTAEHYISAKMFEGTMYEEKIRQASTVAQVRRMIRPRFILVRDEEGMMVKRQGYGTAKDEYYHMRQDWNNVRTKIYQKAIKTKFSQHPSLISKLLETGDSEIIDNSDKLVGPILEKIRKDHQTKKPSPVVSHHYVLKDLPNSHKIIDRIIEYIIKIIRCIAILEGWGNIKIFPPMIDDAIDNILAKIGTLQKQKFSDFEKNIFKKQWSKIYIKYPRFERKIKEIENIIHSSFPRKSFEIPENEWNVAIFRLSLFIWWISFLDKPLTLKIISICKRLSRKKDIILGEGWREYRSSPPKPYIKKRRNVHNLKLIQRNEECIVCGELLKQSEIRLELMMMGGVYNKKRRRMSFPLSQFTKIQKKLYNIVPGSVSYHMLFNEWVRRILYDILSSLHTLRIGLKNIPISDRRSEIGAKSPCDLDIPKSRSRDFGAKSRGDLDNPKGKIPHAEFFRSELHSDIPNSREREFGAKSRGDSDIPRAKFPASGKLQVDSQCESDNIIDDKMVDMLIFKILLYPLRDSSIVFRHDKIFNEITKSLNLNITKRAKHRCFYHLSNIMAPSSSDEDLKKYIKDKKTPPKNLFLQHYTKDEFSKKIPVINKILNHISRSIQDSMFHIEGEHSNKGTNLIKKYSMSLKIILSSCYSPKKVVKEIISTLNCDRDDSDNESLIVEKISKYIYSIALTDKWLMHKIYDFEKRIESF
jgi:N-glycosidase YbiA